MLSGLTVCWTLALQAEDPGAAAHFLQRYDEQLQGGQPCHRVSDFFCGRGGLRADMERHAAGLGMSPALRQELWAYCVCRLDDTVSESPHRDVSWVASRAAASRIPWWSSTVRLKQNLRVAEDPSLGRVLVSVWGDWKKLAVPTTTRRAPRLNTRVFLNAVHRVGSFGLADCSNIASGHRDMYAEALKSREASLPMSARVWRDLRREFVRAVVSDGKVFNAQVAWSAPPSATDMISQCVSSGPSTEQHFRVLDCAVGHKKHNLTTRWMEVKSMAMPMSIQKLSAVDNVEPVSDVSQERILIPDGVTEVIDFLSFIPWTVVRNSLHEWSTAAVRPASASRGGGAFHVSNRVVASARPWVFTDQSTPMVVLIDALLAQGWRAASALADCPHSHSTGADTVAKLFFHQASPAAVEGVLPVSVVAAGFGCKRSRGAARLPEASVLPCSVGFNSARDSSRGSGGLCLPQDVRGQWGCSCRA